MSSIVDHHTSVRRRVGLFLFAGAGAGLIALAAPGPASAGPDVLYAPRVPSITSDTVMLNPQPLPPGPDWSRVALNPQPLPPGPDLRRLVLPRLASR